MNKYDDGSMVRKNRLNLRLTDEELAILEQYKEEARAPSLSIAVREAALQAAKRCQNGAKTGTALKEITKETSPDTPYKENNKENFFAPNNKVICPAADKSATKNKSVLNLAERMEAFRLRLVPYLDKYGRDTLNAFYGYWTERNENGQKMRFEMEKVFDVSRRLATWRAQGNRFIWSGARGQSRTWQALSPSQIEAQNQAKQAREARAAEQQRQIAEQINAANSPEAQAERDKVLARFGKPWKKTTKNE